MFLLETWKFIYKSKNALLPVQTIATHFNRNSSRSHDHFTRNRSANNLSVVPLHLLSYFAQKSIQLKADELWLDIPNDIRQAESYNIFKYLYKKHLITV